MARDELSPASDYANRLLADLGWSRPVAEERSPHPAVRWARSGAMALTGYPGEAPRMCPVPLASYADGVIAALRAIRPGTGLAGIDGACLLGERAALAGFQRAGDVSPGGGCHLMKARDGWLALSLPRASDWELLPAWLEEGELVGWDAIHTALAAHDVGQSVERGRLLGLAIAAMRPSRSGTPARWCDEVHRIATAGSADPAAAPLVVDLSSLWAGPLCTQLLQTMGARVIKVESATRPDGMRLAGEGFHDLLNAGKASVALDLTQSQARARLRSLLVRADIVVEASRPRALRQMGIDARRILEENPALTWISITGHGRAHPWGDWVAFGDDGAVAGGLSQVLWDSHGRAMFGADAVADPLAGLHAALAAWSAYTHGGGRLLSIALADVVAHAIEFASLGDAHATRARTEAWMARVADADVTAPRARAPQGLARELGADTVEVLAEVPRSPRPRTPFR